jgi:hypothetical protein
MYRQRTVRFANFPVESFSRSLHISEAWAVYYLEEHMYYCRICTTSLQHYCHNGYNIIWDVIRLLHGRIDGLFYSNFREGGRPVRVEIPIYYVATREVLGRSRTRTETTFCRRTRGIYL